jgi:hypothetical protein
MCHSCEKVLARAECVCVCFAISNWKTNGHNLEQGNNFKFSPKVGEVHVKPLHYCLKHKAQKLWRKPMLESGINCSQRVRRACKLLKEADWECTDPIKILKKCGISIVCRKGIWEMAEEVNLVMKLWDEF